MGLTSTGQSVFPEGSLVKSPLTGSFSFPQGTLLCRKGTGARPFAYLVGVQKWSELFKSCTIFPTENDRTK